MATRIGRSLTAGRNTRFDARARVVAFIGLFMFSSAAVLHAHLPLTKLNRIFPPGGQRGTTAEVSISGADLDDVDELRFAPAGPEAIKKEGNRFRVTIPTNVPTGL